MLFLGSPCPSFKASDRSRPYILGAWALKKYFVGVALRVTPIIVDYDSTNFLKHCFVVSCLFVQIGASQLAIASSSEASLCPMSGWVCQWIPVEDSLKRALMEEWVFISDVPSEGPSTAEDPMIHFTDHSEFIPVTPRTSKVSTSLPWETAKPQDKAKLRHHFLRCGHGLNATSFIHVNSVPFLSVWYCRFPMR